MFLVGGSFWVSVSALWVALFGFIHSFVSRFQVCLLPQEKSSVRSELEEEYSEVTEINFSEVSDPDEEKSPNFFSKFQFRRYDEFMERNFQDDDDDLVLCSEKAPKISNYQFMSGEAFGVFMEEPEAMSFTVNELYADSTNVSFSFSNGLQKSDSQPEIVVDESFETFKEEGVASFGPGSGFGCDIDSTSNGVLSDGDFENTELESKYEESEEQDRNNVGEQDQDMLSEDFGHVIDSDSISNGFLSDGDFENTEVEDKHEESEEQDHNMLSEDDFHDNNNGSCNNYVPGSGFGDAIDSTSNGFSSDGDFENTESENKHEESDEQDHDNIGDLASNMLSEDDFHDNNDGSCNNSDLEDSTGFESLWEHQDLIEQLTMELKKVRATGLPTIMEETESPRMTEDLKPWRIEDKFRQQDAMGELNGFYKSYRDRMRKFDILNYQKMYAIGFLQSKNPLESISPSKPSIPVIGSLFPEICKRKKPRSEPTTKFMRELHSDLETVYVGQLCLSWEFLHWQYEKTLELWESDPRGIRRYNEVAGEFQQFQVLMQRFIENESFEGPRVQNYVKNRCVLRNLLQVPVVREDGLKNKTKVRNMKGNDAITSDMLVEIMEESIRIFWRFLRADKEATSNGKQKYRRENYVEVQNPVDKNLVTQLRANLHKKERRLKERLRNGNCILRRFQKQEENSTEQVVHFFSQVDMKLVSRVLNMSRLTTDQLLWCHTKLSNINFLNRKINVDPSFSLFPC